MNIKLAFFDMDGTIFHSSLDWMSIRRMLNIEAGQSILKEIYGKTDPDSLRKNRILERFEKRNTLQARPRRGLKKFLCYLDSRHIQKALITNNSAANTHYLLGKYRIRFDCIVTREKAFWKPEPDPFLYVMERLGAQPAESLSIGDSHYDVRASLRAGINRIFIFWPRNSKMPITAEFSCFSSFSELERMLDSV